MNLHEYQSKELFCNAGIPTLEGMVADSPQQARKAAKQLQGNQWAVKAQVHAGGRGKAGGVKMAKSLDDVELIASKMLGSRLITKQTDQMGLPINLVYIERGTQIIFEFYLSLVIDRTKESWTFIASSEGGVDIEMVAEKTPEKINKYTIDPAIGIDTHQLSLMAEKLNLDVNLQEQFIAITKKIFVLAKDADASQVEINPLIVDQNNTFIALDAKIVVDDNSLFRQPELALLKDSSQENDIEQRASENGLSYVSLDGNIACMVNGAGLAMATMDLIKIHGGEPANFLDVGGDATTQRVTAAFELILENRNVSAILVNIFGGIVRCDVIAEGIIDAVKTTNSPLPIVVRLEGTNVQSGKAKLMESGLDIISADDLSDAAEKVVQSAANYRESS
ncbi:MAG TPA: ADP-forming succinate--CoA ligase subunit beta [Gammaproteobacteria bacterium]|jgi:succinyl-CoA synthetase beta subunit|nr:ADP-forming succinate--CoA ligase subunit beta [Gammaproteobacteria bacterium]HIK96630.1 ADP-forming succinate--CoA ligase subunit beta [Gammaproteobacteria bacterium]